MNVYYRIALLDKAALCNIHWRQFALQVVLYEMYGRQINVQRPTLEHKWQQGKQ